MPPPCTNFHNGSTSLRNCVKYSVPCHHFMTCRLLKFHMRFDLTYPKSLLQTIHIYWNYPLWQAQKCRDLKNWDNSCLQGAHNLITDGKIVIYFGWHYLPLSYVGTSVHPSVSVQESLLPEAFKDKVNHSSCPFFCSLTSPLTYSYQRPRLALHPRLLIVEPWSP